MAASPDGNGGLQRSRGDGRERVLARSMAVHCPGGKGQIVSQHRCSSDNWHHSQDLAPGSMEKWAQVSPLTLTGWPLWSICIRFQIPGEVLFTRGVLPAAASVWGKWCDDTQCWRMKWTVCGLLASVLLTKDTAPYLCPPGAEQGWIPLSAVQVDKEDVFICPVAGSGLFKVADAGAAHSCWGRTANRSTESTDLSQEIRTCLAWPPLTLQVHSPPPPKACLPSCSFESSFSDFSSV